MDTITKLERTVLHWFKAVPHLPRGVQHWLGDNIWWITVLVAIVTGLATMGNIFTLLGNQSVIESGSISYYASTSFLVWANVIATINLVFNALTTVILAFAVVPLREKQKKGWVLVFLTLLLAVVSTVVGAIMTQNVIGFVSRILFEGQFIVVGDHLLFEIHGEFAHVERSKGVKSAKKSEDK